eukprot:365307-Chlamydomonas_euryale.AAC.7
MLLYCCKLSFSQKGAPLTGWRLVTATGTTDPSGKQNANRQEEGASEQQWQYRRSHQLVSDHLTCSRHIR